MRRDASFVLFGALLYHTLVLALLQSWAACVLMIGCAILLLSTIPPRHP